MAKATKKVLAPAPTHNPDLLHGIAAATQSGGFQWHSALDVAHLLSAGHVEQNPEMRDEHGRLATRATPAGIAAHMGQVPAHPAMLAPQSVEHIASGSKFEMGTLDYLPEVKRNFGKSTREPTYPFDALTAPITDANTGKVHHSFFFVPATQDEKGEWSQPGRAVGSSLAAQNRKYAVETGETEVKEEYIYQQDANGKRVKVDGHYVKLMDPYGNPAKQKVEVAVTRQEREFTLRTALEGDPRGPGAYIIRIK